MFRLIIAAIIGYTLGKERKTHDKSGGSRTMALICMGSCLVAILSLEMSTVFNFDIITGCYSRCWFYRNGINF